MSKPALAAAFALALGLVTSVDAAASGFLVARFGGEQGHPTTDDPTAMYYNPAGLALRPGRLRIYVNGVIAWRSASYNRPEGAIDNLVNAGMSGTPREAVGANSGEATLFNIIASPFVSVTSDLGVKNLGVGLGFYAPFGGQAVWDQNKAFATGDNAMKYPGAVDGVQRWSSIDGSLRSLYVTAAGSYYIPRARLSFGVGANLVMNSINTVRARNANATDDLVTANGTPAEGRSLLDASGITFSLGAGVIWQPTETMWLGLSYQSQPGFGENTLKGSITNKLGVGAVASQDIEFKQALPDVVRLGWRWRPAKRAELRLFGEYVRWSVFQRQCVLDSAIENRKCAIKPDGSVDTANGGAGVILNLQRDWKDAFGVRAGGSYWATPDIEVFLGAGWDGNAVPDAAMDPTLFDMDKLTFSGGGRFTMVRQKLAIAVTYTQVVYLSRTVAPRGTDPLPPSRSPDNAGTYKQSIGLVSLGVEYLF